MPSNKTQRVSDLFDRWRFAGAVLLMEAGRIHEVRGCCIFDISEPRLCLGLAALQQSVYKLNRESEEFIKPSKLTRTDVERLTRNESTGRPVTLGNQAGGTQAGTAAPTPAGSRDRVVDPDYDLESGA